MKEFGEIVTMLKSKVERFLILVFYCLTIFVKSDHFNRRFKERSDWQVFLPIYRVMTRDF